MSQHDRSRIEDFLYHEADLLDSWRLTEWLALFTDDALYEVPCTDLPADARPDESLFYVADDRFRLGERVKRLMKKTAHSEYPHSRTRRIVGNVRIRSQSAELLEIGSVFACYRTKDGTTDLYFGSTVHQLVPADGGFRIRSKRCLLDGDGLRPAGRLSIIL
jgi:p-cumate 2,3-dioxygenase subunit beta